MNELYFKIIAVVLAIGVYLIRRPYTRNSLDTKQLIKNTIIVFLVVLLFTSFFDFARMSFSFFVRMIGLLVIIFGLFLLYWAHKVLGKNWKSLLNLRKFSPKELITSGPYQYVRHPIYLAGIIKMVGFLLFISNWFIVGIPLILYTVFYLPKIKQEEKVLIKIFGEKYKSYMKKTGGLFPRL